MEYLLIGSVLLLHSCSLISFLQPLAAVLHFYHMFLGKEPFSPICSCTRPSPVVSQFVTRVPDTI